MEQKIMTIAAEIRAKLPICGRCINCKLVIWDSNAELKTAQNLIRFKELEQNFFYMVRCSWLKTPVFEPQYLMSCEGKQLQKREE
jgi:hypothetical protein